ncbi:ATP-binding protein [Solitalea sp. MAHUQ-68]|uniref:Sensory/regulatory protein RpfC n=1 Tax=Solitalea agri TaxID=2953739 RepID=A0A9X2JF53_9SPHI|nr:ATP-binding protein [Solitalea agri]MCO4294625.1 ATP-binding protein [Solitalea agri]
MNRKNISIVLFTMLVIGSYLFINVGNFKEHNRSSSLSLKQINTLKEINYEFLSTAFFVRESIIRGDYSVNEKVKSLHSSIDKKLFFLKSTMVDQEKTLDTISNLFQKRKKIQFDLLAKPGKGLQKELLKQTDSNTTAFYKVTNSLLSRWEKLEHKKALAINFYSSLFLAVLAFISAIIFINKSVLLFRTQKQLKQTRVNEKQYLEFVENLADAVVATDINRYITFASSKFSKMFGYTTQELIGKNIIELGSSDSIQEMKAHKHELKTSQVPIVSEVLFISKNGKMVWVELKSTKIDPDRRERGFLHTVKDITEARSIKEELKASEKERKKTLNLLLDIFQNLESTIVYVKDLKGTYLLASPSAKKFFGMDPVGKNNYDFFSQLKSTHFEKLDNEVISSRKILKFEYINEENIQPAHFMMVRFPLFDSTGEIYGVGVIANDITEEVQRREELIAAKETAEYSERMQEQFLANMSHEIRTPLNGISGMNRLLLETHLTEQQRDFANSIKTSAINLLDIINGLLDLSKIKAGKMTFETIDFDVLELLDHLNRGFQLNLKQGIQLELNIDLSLPKVLLGDPLQLRQILVNLIGNAIKFTSEGKIVVTITAEKNANGILLKGSVADSGIGISEEKITEIFKPFVQAEAEITRQYGGTGLGLSITKQLLELQGGTIDVSSELDKGSTFSFTLPLGLGDETKVVIKTKEEAISSSSFKGRKFLLVEDQEVNQKLIFNLIKKAGGQIVIAQNGKEAVHILETNNKFDLILMDLHMPEMGGVTATSYIRKTLKLKIPIMAMTASAMKGEREYCLFNGMDEYLSKPFEFTVFYKKINELLGDKLEFTTTDSEITPALYDLGQLAELDDMDYLMEIITTYIETVPVILSQIQEAVYLKNWDDVRSHAHKAKSPVGLFQATALYELLNEIECNAKEKTALNTCSKQAERAIELNNSIVAELKLLKVDC